VHVACILDFYYITDILVALESSTLIVNRNEQYLIPV
jgi:hypothetical protein